MYNTNGTRTVTNSRGQASTYSTAVQLGVALVTDIAGPGCSTCGGSNTSYQYDPANNNLLGETENGVTTQYGNYDTRGQYGYKIEAVGTPEARRTDYTYDARFFNKITSMTEPSVNPAGSKLTSHSYDDFGNRLSEVISGFAPDGQGGYGPVSRTTTRQYAGPLNQLSFTDGPRTDVNDFTTYRYYTDDPLEGNNRARLQEIEDANGVLTRSNIHYSATGKVLSESRPNGLTLTYTYYPGNYRLETLTESDGTTSRVTRWTYLATGEVATITTADGTPDATTLTFGYDDARRLTRITDGLGNYIEYTLDTEGNRTAEKTYDSTSTLRKALTQTFDIYNRLDGSSQANEVVDYNFAPDGTLDQLTDGEGSVTDSSYDALRRLATTTQALGSLNVQTQYGYDVADRLTSVTDPNGNATTYGYDDLGNLLAQTSPDTGTTGFQYDAAGNLTTKTDAKGQVFTYSYDALNRLTSLDVPGTADDLSYTYDTCANGVGRLCSVVGSTATTTYAYDAFGNVTAHQSVSYSHDAANRVSTMTYPSGAEVTYSYDAAGQVSQVQLTRAAQTDTLASTIAYAPFGPVESLLFGNGLGLSQPVDSAYRTQSQTIAGIQGLTYSLYDANGNLTQRDDSLSASSLFSYDAVNRLDTASGAFGSRDYDYDPNSNRTQLNAGGALTTYAYAPASNRLDAVDSTDIALDANGNTTAEGARSFTHTTQNRLFEVYDGGTLTVSYAYNGLGQRVTKTFPDATGRRYVYGTNGELLAETSLAGMVLIEYVYLNGTLIAQYQPDSDGDGQTNWEAETQGGQSARLDTDRDGLSDATELALKGTHPNQADSDGDGFGDGYEVAQQTDPLDRGRMPSVAQGDVNGDGELGIADAIRLAGFAMELTEPTTQARAAADMNLDGEIDASDGALLLRQILGMAQPAQVEATGRSLTQRLLAWLLDTVIEPAHANPPGLGKVYYVHTDHLGTPVAMTDEVGIKVWGAAYDPFGAATPNEDPDGNGTPVTLNVRFPGQYYDQETNLHYNYFRYYDPATGRYLTSDPIGLGGGLNTYGYVGGNPITRADPLGLIYRCIQPLDAWPGGFNGGIGPLHHAFVCDDQGNNCYGHDWDRSRWWSSPWFAPGRPSEDDKFDENNCSRIEPENDCVNKCTIERSKNTDRPFYSLPFSWSIAPVFPNCQEYADQEITRCIMECERNP